MKSLHVVHDTIKAENYDEDNLYIEIEEHGLVLVIETKSGINARISLSDKDFEMILLLIRNLQQEYKER